MRKVYLIAALFACVNARAQTFIGLKSGLAFSMAQDNVGTSYSPVFPTIVSGVSFERGFGKSLVVGAELLYEQRKFSWNGNYTDNLGNPKTIDKNGHIGCNAISMPIFFGFKSTLKTVYISFSCGVIPSYMPSPYTKGPYIANPKDASEAMAFSGEKYPMLKSYFDISAMANLGAGVKVGKFEIGVNARGQYSLTPFGIGNYRIIGIAGTLNVMYQL